MITPITNNKVVYCTVLFLYHPDAMANARVIFGFSIKSITVMYLLKIPSFIDFNLKDKNTQHVFRFF